MTTRPEDDPGLDGRVAIVTGGGAADDGIGNGRAAAMLLARAGTKVARGGPRRWRSPSGRSR